MKATATCNFKHEGVDYAAGAAVALDGSQLAALARAGLVDLDEGETGEDGTVEGTAGAGETGAGTDEKATAGETAPNESTVGEGGVGEGSPGLGERVENEDEAVASQAQGAKRRR